MLFCRNCGVQMPDDSKFCANCGTAVLSTPTNANIHTVNNQTSPPMPTSERLLTNDGLCYEYERGMELEVFYPNQKTERKYKTAIIVQVIWFVFFLFVIIFCSLATEYVENQSFLYRQRAKDALEAFEFAEKLSIILIILSFIQLLLFSAARILRNEHILHVCENGIYGKASSFFSIKKFDIPFSKIDNITPDQTKGLISEKCLIIHTRATDLIVYVGHVNTALSAINQQLIR